jgi:hypothetical protein
MTRLRRAIEDDLGIRCTGNVLLLSMAVATIAFAVIWTLALLADYQR